LSNVIDEEESGLVPVLPFAPEQFLETKSCAIGLALRSARLSSNLSVQAIADRTRIRSVYIDALEAGRLDQFTAPIYAVGFASSYARALGLDPEWAAQAMRDYIGNAPKAWRRSGWVH
jgi:cytoskeletal protein RodZ